MTLLRRRSGQGSAIWLAAPGLLFLAVFFLAPVVNLLFLSLQDPATHGLSASAYERLLAQSVYLRVLGNTFVLAFQVSLAAVLLGYPVAYWLAMMPQARRNRLLVFVLLPFWTSALIKTFAWIVLLARTGVVVGALRATGLISAPVELLYGRGAVVLGMTHALVPLAVLTMLPVMAQIDRHLQRAAQTLGASGIQTFWRVFFHMSLPGLAAAGLLVFVSALGFFITPSLIGSPRDTTLAPLIIAQIESMLTWNFAAALAMLLVLSTLAVCAVYNAVFGLSTVAGGAAKPGRHSLGIIGVRCLGALANGCEGVAWAAGRLTGNHSFRWLLPAIAWAVVAFLGLPTLAIVPMAFTSGRFLSFPPPGYSLHWMAAYLGSPVWMEATLRSFGLAFATGLLASALAGFAAYAVVSSRTRWSGLVFALFLAPMIVPSIVTALALFYLLGKLSLAGTDAGLLIGHTVLAMPLVFVTQLAIFRTYDWRLDQAAATLGANRARSLRRVTLPLIKGGLAASFLLAFIASFEELTVAIFVGGGLRTTLPKQLWDDMLQQVNPTAAAASVFVLAVVAVMFLAAQRLRLAQPR
ncbi:MAG: ABC transporter permease subunit [Acetobacteraceae bacterium]